MSIVRKDAIKDQLQQLDEYYQKLKTAASGTPPNPNQAHDYNCETEQFQREYTDIDLDVLHDQISFFKVSVDSLKRIKKKVVKRNHR